jgi:hypothetical protein
MGSFCCNNFQDKQNETNFEEIGQSSKRITSLSPMNDQKLFTVIEVLGDDTGQSYLRYSSDTLLKTTFG